MLEVLLVMVAVEHGEAEHAASDLLSLLLQLGKVLLGIICKSPGRVRQAMGLLQDHFFLFIPPTKPADNLILWTNKGASAIAWTQMG